MIAMMLYSTENPTLTYVRTDRAHNIKICLKMFKRLDKNNFRLYSRIFGVQFLSTSIDESKKIIENIFIVLLNRYQHTDSVINAIKILKQLGGTHQLEINDNGSNMQSEMKESEMEELVNDDIIDTTDKTHFFTWVEDIVNFVEYKYVNNKLNDSIEDAPVEVTENSFYSPTMQTRFVKFLAKIHLWSKMMNKCFGSHNMAPSSACSESDFKRTKHNVVPRTRVRADVFIRQYVEHLEGFSMQKIVRKKTTKQFNRRNKFNK